jgi:hypothetical protein
MTAGIAARELHGRLSFHQLCMDRRLPLSDADRVAAWREAFDSRPTECGWYWVRTTWSDWQCVLWECDTMVRGCWEPAEGCSTWPYHVSEWIPAPSPD